jgi:hypothetical protein
VEELLLLALRHARVQGCRHQQQLVVAVLLLLLLLLLSASWGVLPRLWRLMQPMACRRCHSTQSINRSSSSSSSSKFQ